MTPKQLAGVLKLSDRERRRELRDNLAINTLAARADPKEIQKMLNNV